MKRRSPPPMVDLSTGVLLLSAVKHLFVNADAGNQLGRIPPSASFSSVTREPVALTLTISIPELLNAGIVGSRFHPIQQRGKIGV